MTVSGSGVQRYDWDRTFLSSTRHLKFDVDQHKASVPTCKTHTMHESNLTVLLPFKILETELKMLYTAITRSV